jgi:hypothetical protein
LITLIIDTVIRSGGVFQNRLVPEAVTLNLEVRGLKVLNPRPTMVASRWGRRDHGRPRARRNS